MSYYLVGIDEAGYGPTLGPLVVTAVVWEVPSAGLDLWRHLKQAVTPQPTLKSPHRRPADEAWKRLPVCDSKIIYRPQAGIKSLETSVLAFTSLLSPDLISGPLTIRSYLKVINYAPEKPITDLPWYGQYQKLTLPLAGESHRINQLATRLAKNCRAKSTKLVRVLVRMVEADGFNGALKRHKNKAELLFEATAELLAILKRDYFSDDNQVEIFIGKQGGRCYYGAHLERVFQPCGVRFLREVRNCSDYAILAGNKEFARLKFLVDGEAAHFTIALASMFCKYTRELGMKMFNTFWSELGGPDLKPTAGYYTDSRRFLREITPLSRKLGLEHELFVRQK